MQINQIEWDALMSERKQLQAIADAWRVHIEAREMRLKGMKGATNEAKRIQNDKMLMLFKEAIALLDDLTKEGSE